MRPGRQRGQATVETLAMVPLILLTSLLLTQAVMWAGVALHGDRAAHAAALADARGGSARLAARESIPDWSRNRVTVKRTARFVHVSVRPRSIVPGLGQAITVHTKFERPKW